MSVNGKLPKLKESYLDSDNLDEDSLEIAKQSSLLKYLDEEAVIDDEELDFDRGKQKFVSLYLFNINQNSGPK